MRRNFSVRQLRGGQLLRPGGLARLHHLALVWGWQFDPRLQNYNLGELS
jgi:hypothetical protein